MGASTQWMLSHALFSSNKIDDGTHLLLKTIAKEISLDSCRTALDIGCGTGILGGAVQSRFPHIHTTVQDRDALALNITAENYRKNNLKEPALQTGLALEGIEESYDLILSNIPAKIGTPVLKKLITDIPAYLTDPDAGSGTAAVVVISSLKTEVEDILNDTEAHVTFTEHSKNYSVFHFQGKRAAIPEFDFSPYIRGRNRFNYKKSSYSLETVYNLPDFDMLSYRDISLFSCLNRHPVSGSIAVYNPGQGHIPVYLTGQRRLKEISLFSRDLLQLKISELNLADKNVEYQSRHIPFPEALTELNLPRRSHIAVYTEKIPGVSPGRYWHCPEQLLDKNGTVSFTGQSAEIFLLTKESPAHYTSIDSIKHRGFRTVLYQKT